MRDKVSVSVIVSVMLTAAVIAAAVFGLRSTEAARGDEARRALEDSLRRAAVSCYVIEGSYPDTLKYLCENYGVSYDAERYAVFYEIFASNVMPDITVTELEAHK